MRNKEGGCPMGETRAKKSVGRPGEKKEVGRKKLLLFGGTTEGRLLAEYISGLDCRLLVCVATEYGRELLPEQVAVRAGRLDADGIQKLIKEENPGMIIDATHPYATEATENIRTACTAFAGVRYLRCMREAAGGIGKEAVSFLKNPEKLEQRKALDKGELVCVPDADAAVRWLSGRNGNVLLTTGSKELAAYSRLKDYKSRLYVRVLPASLSLEACRKLGIDESHIIAAQGPFSEEMNRAQLKRYHCSILVTKDGGAAGGFKEKLRAAWAEGACAVVIQRPDKGEGFSLEEVKRQVREWIKQGD